MLADTLPSDQQMLMTLAGQLTEDCPDMREMAEEEIAAADARAALAGCSSLLDFHWRQLPCAQFAACCAGMRLSECGALAR